MGQILTKSRATVLIIVVALALNLHLLLIIKPDFEEVPTTKVWLCLEWIGIVTEVAVGAIWYTLKKE